MIKYLQVGKIVNTHGLKGELKVKSLTADNNRFKDLKSVFISKDPIKNESNLDDYVYKIKSVKFMPKFVVIKIDGVDDIDSACEFKNTFISVNRENAVKLPENAHFICDLIGCEVFEGENSLGTIKDIIETGSNDVYIVKNSDKKEILIPALKTVVNNISIENRRIDVTLPKGLIDHEV